MRIVLVIAVAFGASACASDGTSDDRAAEYAAQREACASRGGMLTQSMDRRLTGKPGGGYECRISGGATRIPPPTTAG